MTLPAVTSRPEVEHDLKSAPRRWVSALAKAFGFEYHDMLLGVTDLNSFRGSPAISPQLSVVRATNQEIFALTESLTSPTSYWFGQASQWGSYCYVLRHENRCAGYVWINPRIIVHQGTKLIDLPRSFAFAHSSHMLTEFRGKGLYSTLVRESFLDQKQRGSSYMVSLIERRNLAAMVEPKSFSVVRRPSPILILPGLRPLVFGEGFRMLRKRVANPTGI